MNPRIPYTNFSSISMKDPLQLCDEGPKEFWLLMVVSLVFLMEQHRCCFRMGAKGLDWDQVYI